MRARASRAATGRPASAAQSQEQGEDEPPPSVAPAIPDTSHSRAMANRKEAALMRRISRAGGVARHRVSQQELVEVEVINREDGCPVSLKVPQSANIRQVKEALIAKVGRGEVSQVHVFLFSGTEAQHLDSNIIGATRKFWASGFSPSSKPGQEAMVSGRQEEATTAISGCTGREAEKAATNLAAERHLQRKNCTKSADRYFPFSGCKSKARETDVAKENNKPEAQATLTKTEVADYDNQVQEDALMASTKDDADDITEVSAAVKPKESNQQRRVGSWTRMLESSSSSPQRRIGSFSRRSDMLAEQNVGVDEQRDLGHSLFEAVRKQDMQTVQSLLLSKVSADAIDNFGYTPLSKAVMCQHFDLCVLLLLFEADPNLRRPPSECATTMASRRPGSKLDELFKHRQGMTRIVKTRFAVSAGIAVVVEKLLSNPAEAEDVDSDAQTLLHLCAKGEKSLCPRVGAWVQIANHLLRLGADINAVNKYGDTALALAVRRTVKNEAGSTKGTPEHSFFALCEEIVQWSADVNIAEHISNTTPLTEAVKAGNTGLTKLLMDARGDPTHKCSDGQTAFSLARSPDILKLLVDSTVKPGWSDLERSLYRSTRAQFNPDIDLHQELFDFTEPGKERCKVSVICPTLQSRGEFHRGLYACFDAQTYPDKELIVVETGEEPSHFFNDDMLQKDPRITYRFYKDLDRHERTISVGVKRNIAVRLARGAIIAHFDDDDLYSQGYLEQMVNIIFRHGAHVLKLSSWFVLDLGQGRLGYCDPEVERANKGDVDVDSALFGYGFSYIYRRDLAIRNPFPDAHLGEDFEFVRRIQHQGYSVCLWPDLDGISLHLQHGKNSSSSFPNDYITWEMLECMQVSRTKAANDMVRKYRHLMKRREVHDTKSPRMLDLAIAVMGMRGRAAEAISFRGGSDAHEIVPEVVRVVEEEEFYDDAALADAFKELHRPVKLIVSSDYADFEYFLPWTSRVLDAKKAVAKDFGGLLSQVRLMDAENSLRDDQLLLYRRRLQCSVIPEMDDDGQDAELVEQAKIAELSENADDEAVEHLRYHFPDRSEDELRSALVASEGTVFGAVQVLMNEPS